MKFNLLNPFAAPTSRPTSRISLRTESTRIVCLAKRSRIPGGHRFTAVLTACVAEKNRGKVMAVFCMDGIATDSSNKPMTIEEVLNTLATYAKKKSKESKRESKDQPRNT